MPADRMLHPRLGHSKKVNLLTDQEFRVWVHYLLAADDFGVMRCEAVALQAGSDHLANRPRKAVQRSLERLVGVGLIRTFEHQGRVYVYQPDWQDWQHIGYPRATINPCPPLDECSDKTRALFVRHSANIPETLPEHSDPSRARETAHGLRLPANGPEASGSHARATAVTGSGAMAGTLPRDHLRHVTPCGRVCVPQFLHGQFVQQIGGDPEQANDRLRGFYRDTLSAIPDDQPIGDEPLAFWRKHFAAWLPSAAPSGMGSSRDARLKAVERELLGDAR